MSYSNIFFGITLSILWLCGMILYTFLAIAAWRGGPRPISIMMGLLAVALLFLGVGILLMERAS